jgi:hypothetical protein
MLIPYLRMMSLSGGGEKLFRWGLVGESRSLGACHGGFLVPTSPSSLMLSLLPACHEISSLFLHMLLLPWCSASSLVIVIKSADHGLKPPKLSAKTNPSYLRLFVTYSITAMKKMDRYRKLVPEKWGNCCESTWLWVWEWLCLGKCL